MIAALFPGQNSQAVGMGKDFYEHSRAAKAVLDEAESALPGLLEMMFAGPEETLKLTAHQQPALVAASAAAYAAYLEAGGAKPAFVAGHSLGEFSAHVAAGSLRLADATLLVHKRGRFMQDAVPAGVGAMAAILKVKRDVVENALTNVAGVVEIANLNAPEQTVISGELAAVEEAAERLRGAGARVVMLNVSAPFHCSLMRPAAEKLAAELQQTPFAPLQMPLLCNVTADILQSEHDARGMLEQQVTASVRWVETLEHLARLGVTQMIEFGSGNVLAGLVKRTLKDMKVTSVTNMQSLQEVL